MVLNLLSKQLSFYLFVYLLLFLFSAETNLGCKKERMLLFFDDPREVGQIEIWNTGFGQTLLNLCTVYLLAKLESLGLGIAGLRTSCRRTTPKIIQVRLIIMIY